MPRIFSFLLLTALLLALPVAHKEITAAQAEGSKVRTTARAVGEAFNQQRAKQNQTAEIEAYASGLDRYAKRNARAGRYFADVSNYEKNEPARWREFRTKRALDKAWQDGGTYTSANVWPKPTGEMIVVFTFSSPSGDWAQYMTNYYRSDGTLAKSNAELRTFMGDIIRISDRFYDAGGKLLREQTRYLDLTTKKPKKVKEGDFMEVEAPLYKKTGDLPFHSLLKKR